MKTAISLPDDLFRRVEAGANRLGLTRSAFFAQAASRLLDELDSDDVTAQIDAAIERGGTRAAEQRRSWAEVSTAALASMPDLDDDKW